MNYDNPNAYDSALITYEGAGTTVLELSFLGSLTSARTLGMGFTRAATASASFSPVRQAALTLPHSVTGTIETIRATTLPRTVTAAVSNAHTRLLSAYRTFSNDTTITYTTTRQTTLTKDTTVTATTERINQTFKELAATITATLDTILASVWNVTAALTGISILGADPAKTWETNATLTGTSLIEALPINEGAARDIARDDTHDEAVLTYDRNGNQLYLPVRPTSTL